MSLKLEPCPRAVRQVSSPPYPATSSWLIASPRPVPRPGGFVVKNGSKIRSRSAGSIPSVLGHPAVRMAAVVGAPDPERTEIVKAYVVLNDGFAASDRLTRELQDHVRTRLAAHEYPRQVRYIDALPLTTTGKIIRRELRDRRD